MKIPSKVKVGTLDYVVETKHIEKVDALNNGRTINADQFTMGSCNHAKLEIAIMQELKHEAQLHTLFHETMHAIIRLYGIKTDREEELCDLGSTIILQFLNDNIEEIKWKE